MSLNVFHKTGDGTGVLQKIAGHTILLDATASEVREGTASFTDPTWGSFVDVTFSDPMPDTDYKVILEYPWDGQSWGGESTPADVAVHNKTTTGFRLTMWPVGTVNKVYINWTAFKLIKLDGYTELQNKVNNPDSTPTEDSLNLVTSGGVYDAIKDSGKIWRGTQEEWDALPAADRDFYDQAEISGVNNDGMVYVADKIENGNMNAVTSNAVYNALMNTTIIQSDVKRSVTQDPTKSTWYVGGLQKPTIPAGKRLVRWLAFTDSGDISVSVGSRDGGIDNCILLHGDNDRPTTPITFNIWWGAEVADR
jgi:hypothetical protein